MLLVQVCYKIPDTKVLAHADIMSLHTLLIKYQLRWVGHVIRMQDTHLPKKLVFGELKSGKQTCGGQQKCFKDTLKASLKRFIVDVDNWETLTQEWDIWRSIIVDGAVTSESDRVKEAENKRQLHKSRANDNSISSLPTNLVYPKCHRLFHAQIGLF